MSDIDRLMELSEKDDLTEEEAEEFVELMDEFTEELEELV